MKNKIYIIKHLELPDGVLVSAKSMTEAIQKFLNYYNSNNSKSNIKEEDIEDISIYDDAREIIV